MLKREIPRLKLAIAAAGAIIFLILMNVPAVNRLTENFFYTIFSPLGKPWWRLGGEVSGFFNTLTKINNLKTENEGLRAENADLLSRLAALEEQKKENENLRVALGLGLEKEFKLVMAEIIAKDISQDAILINKGLRDGLAVGLTALTSEKALVGMVGEVYENFSRLILISNTKISFDAQIQESDAAGVAKGMGGLRISFGLLPKDKEIKTGELVVTTSLGGIFPKGILVGRVKKIEKNDLAPFQEAEIAPIYDLPKTKSVFIITGLVNDDRKTK